MKLNMRDLIRSQATPVYQGHMDKEVQCPCWDCPHSDRCKAEELACEAYRVYTSNKSTYSAPELWKNESRIPSSKIFKSLR